MSLVDRLRSKEILGKKSSVREDQLKIARALSEELDLRGVVSNVELTQALGTALSLRPVNRNYCGKPGTVYYQVRQSYIGDSNPSFLQEGIQLIKSNQLATDYISFLGIGALFSQIQTSNGLPHWLYYKERERLMQEAKNLVRLSLILSAEVII